MFFPIDRVSYFIRSLNLNLIRLNLYCHAGENMFIQKHLRNFLEQLGWRGFVECQADYVSQTSLWETSRGVEVIDYIVRFGVGDFLHHKPVILAPVLFRLVHPDSDRRCGPGSGEVLIIRTIPPVRSTHRGPTGRSRPGRARCGRIEQGGWLVRPEEDRLAAILQTQTL